MSTRAQNPRSEVMTIQLIREPARRGVRLRNLIEPFLDVDTSASMARRSSPALPWISGAAADAGSDAEDRPAPDVVEVRAGTGSAD